MSQRDREKWDARYASGSHEAGAVSTFLRAKAAALPGSGRVLDVAGGAGRNALWLAERGLEVTLVDVSPVGLQLAQRRAAERGVRLTTAALDLEVEPLPAGPWDAIVSVLYLQRGLFRQFHDRLAPGGLLFFLQPTTTNLERHPRPPRSFLLEPGELARLIAQTALEVIELDESWSATGHHEARLVARRSR